MFSVATIITLSAWLLMACSYAGWGRMTLKALGLYVPGGAGLFTLVWLGWSVSLMMLNFLQLFVPLSVYVSLAMFGCGGLLAYPLLRERRHYSFHLPRGAWVLLVVLVGLTATWVASFGMLTPGIYDSGLYHFSVIRWLNEYPIVPGLGNLHGRLAFNQSFFAYVAALNFYPLFGHGHNLANGFLFMVLAAEGLFCVFVCVEQWRTERLGLRVGDVVPVFFRPALAFMTLQATLSSPSPDPASCILQILLFVAAVRSLDPEVRGEDRVTAIALVLVLASTAVTVKMSSLLYAGLIAGTVLASQSFAFWRTDFRRLWRPCAMAAGLAGFILVLWAGRGVILSGYPAYPSRAGAVHVDWAVPAATVHDEARWIQSWARKPFGLPNEVLGNWAWLRPWFADVLKARVAVVYPCAAAVLAIAALSVVWSRAPVAEARRRVGVAVLLLLPVIGGLVFWFLAAPDVRFANALFWILPVAACVPLLMPGVGGAPWRTGLFSVAATWLLVNGAIGFWVVGHGDVWRHWPARWYQALPVANVTVKQTDSGLSVWTPVDDSRVWNAALPATPYFNAHLRLRGKNLSSGFTVRSPDSKEGGL